VTVSIKRMSAGDGYRYLMQTVAVGDGRRPAATPMTRYYTEVGTPVGRWLGAGLDGLGAGKGLTLDSEVTEEQLFHLIGMGNDPVTGDPLGNAPQAAGPGYRERVRARLTALPPGLSPDERLKRVEEIRREERERAAATAGKAVTGFDLTFSVPKSVSAVWAIADADVQAKIVDAHHAAIRDAIVWAEANVFCTRVGKGGAVQVPVRGVIAASFDHFDSRANDPHLHTHVVVANRVQTEVGGKWRTLDSRALFRATVALSELHQGLLMDRITQVLGAGWDGRRRRHSPVPQLEISGVPDALRAEFSQRATEIDKKKDVLVAAYRDVHGRSPDAATVLKLRQQATLESRPDKHVRSLAELTAQWRTRAVTDVGPDTEAWVRALPPEASSPLRSADLTADHIQLLAEQTIAAVADKRATFSRWNVYAETQRQLHRVRFTTAAERMTVADRIADSALGLAIVLTPPDLVPAALRHGSIQRYTTQQIFDAEERLLEAGRSIAGPALATASTRTGVAPDQAAVVDQIVRSGHELDVLVGAAGTGKTTTMAALAAAWQQTHGPGSVIGLAPSAAAAEVLSDELRLPTENTAKWLIETEREGKRLTRIEALGRVLKQVPKGSPQARRLVTAMRELDAEVQQWRLKPDQLVIVDEASLAGTLTLDRIVAQARTANAKVLLVGDWAQLSSVDAGGAFGMLARDRVDTPELVDVRRFHADWEKHASLALRGGDPKAIDAYAEHGRIHEGDRGDVVDRAYAAWLTDRENGKRSLLIAADAGTVTDLNTRARNDLVAIGRVAAEGVELADGTVAGRGDEIVTRRNARELVTGSTWVKNGDRWTVVDAHHGELTVQRADGLKSITLPAEYVTGNVELGYATTTHRAQGQTVDTAHTVVTSPVMTREALYVAATRAREGNHLYVAVDDRCDVESVHGAGRYATGREVLTAIVNNLGTDISAHEVLQKRGTSPEAPYQPIGHVPVAGRNMKTVHAPGPTVTPAISI